jgi:Cu(I)/Ag(I) efflux system membrane fusion protein
MSSRETPGSAGAGGEPVEPAGPPRGVRTMAVVRWVLVVLTGVVAVVSILGYAGVHLGGHETGASDQLYYCPMHPSVVQDHPGECPICNMTLVPKPTSSVKPAPAANTGVPGLSPVDLPPERVQLIGLRTTKVLRETIGGELRTVGVVAPREQGLSQINTRFAGWIEKLFVSETGERVRRGQVLAAVYSPDVLRAQEELLVAHRWSAGGDQAKTGAASDSLAAGVDADARRRLELLGISSQEVEAILRTGKASDAIPIRSPVDGYVITKNAVAGLAIQPGTVLFEIADLAKVWVTADVHELDVARVHVGQTARLELAAYPGQSYTGKLEFVYPVLDSESRTLRVRLEFKNQLDKSGPRLRPGMYGTIYLDLPPKTGLMVPAEAVVDTGETRYLFVARKGGRFEPRVVKIGGRVKDRVEVSSGVAEGETVVTTGNFLIDSESRLRAAIDAQK